MGKIPYFDGHVPWQNVSSPEGSPTIKSHEKSHEKSHSTTIFLWFSYGFPMVLQSFIPPHLHRKIPGFPHGGWGSTRVALAAIAALAARVARAPSQGGG